MDIEIYINLNIGMDIVCRHWEELIEWKKMYKWFIGESIGYENYISKIVLLENLSWIKKNTKIMYVDKIIK